MGIRLKIALGFILLTIVVISVVSFWAAQSLGVSLDSSDLNKLENLNNIIITRLDDTQKDLDRVCAEAAQTLAKVNFFALDSQQQQRIAEKLKSSLQVDWLEIFNGNTPLLAPNTSFSRPVLSSGRPLRLASSGPFSYRGYLTSATPIAGYADYTLYISRKPEFDSTVIPLFYIFDAQGVLVPANADLNPVFVQRMARENVTDQLQINREIFRVRVFNNKQRQISILTGYLAQRASISRANVDELMLRLAILEVIGLLMLGLFLGRKLLYPLKELRHGIEQVADGHWKEIPLDKPPMQGSGDEIETVARSFNHMVRELSLAQNRLIEVQKELAKKDKMSALGRFSAGIAHEINNPLGTILVTAGMLKEAAAKGTSIPAEEFDEIIDEVKRCRDIIATLRIYTSRTQPNLSRQFFSDFFATMKKQVLAENEFKALEISFTLKDNSDRGEILVDNKAMQQVFHNLIKNAAEAMHDLTTRQVNFIAERLPDHFCIKIQDHGRGFECLPEHIFEPLFTTKAQGTGLGLVICQAIIEGHNGKIEANRIDNSITEFLIRLPVAPVRKDDPDDMATVNQE